jgi:hypothetical protein
MDKRAAGLAKRGRPKMSDDAKAEARLKREAQEAQLKALLANVSI